MECEIHVDGDLLFCAFGALGAGLAYLTYTAITAKGKRRRKREANVGWTETFFSSFEPPDLPDLLLLGIYKPL